MTNCKECLTALSTARVADIDPGSAIALHCYTCPECNRVAEEVRYAEYRLAASLNEAKPSADGVQMGVFVAGESERLRRRRIGRWIRIGLAIPAAAILGLAWEAMTEGDSPRGVITETIALKCLTSQQALELATPYLRSSGARISAPANLRAITMSGQSGEFAAAKMEIERFDGPDGCAIPGTPAPTTIVPNQPYLEFQVEKPATQLPGTGSPRYPDALRSSGVEGEVQGQFVVNEDGKADASTFKVLKTTNDLFSSSVRSALPNMRFNPAELGDRKVKQLVQQSFQFKLDR